MKISEVKGSVGETLSTIKKDAAFAKAIRLVWAGFGLYSAKMFIEHTRQLGRMDASKVFVEGVEEMLDEMEESGE